MLIDWFTVAAQAANFLILVWLLKRFLYQPILGAIDARDQRIAAQLLDAETEQAEANRQRDEFRQKNEAFEHQRAALLENASAAANAERRRLLEAARSDAEALRARLQDTLRAEQLNLDRELTGRTQREVFAVVRKALADLADASLEQRMVEVFLNRLRELAAEERAELCAVFAAAPHPARVRSAFDLPPEQQTKLAAALREVLGSELQLQFETAPGQIGGIELVGNGRKLAWSIADYLAALEKSLAGSLQLKSGANPEVDQARL